MFLYMRHSPKQFLLLILLAWVGLNCQAAEQADQQQTPDNVDREAIAELIETLESQTAREEFISNLKTLIDYGEDAKAETSPWDASEWFNIGQFSQNIAEHYTVELEQLGVSRGLAGKLIVVAVTGALLLVVVYANRQLAGILNRRIDPLRRRLRLSPNRFRIYFTTQVRFGYALALAVFLYVVSELSGLFPGFLRDNIEPIEIFAYILTFLILWLLFATAWELGNFAMEYGAQRNKRLSRARIDSLLPVVRNFLFVVLSIIAVLVILAEIGIDITPLLAGAGVVGIAVGFGAQTLVRDFITGFIIIFEDLVAVGDVVGVGGKVGIVEKLSIRKVELRDLDGTVYTVPFSEISIVDNLTKDFSYYLMDIGVAYREDVDEVMACLHDVLAELREADNYRESILADLEILGLDRFDDSAVIIRARIKTRAHDKWFVGREFNRRMKKAFDERNIEIPFPHTTLYFGESKKGSAPAAHVRIIDRDLEEEPGDDRRETGNADATENVQGEYAEGDGGGPDGPSAER